MKTLSILLVLIIIIGGIFWLGSRDNSPVPNEEGAMMEQTGEITGDRAAINLEESRVTWTGRKILIPGYEDTGVMPIKEGALIVSEGNVVGGEFTFNVAEINAETDSNENATPDMLTRHLRSEDFFDVENYPEARFVATKIESRSDLVAENATHLVTGNLTIKDVTAPVSFPALITVEDGKINIEALFDIDRTTWNVRYGSGSFFDNLGDNIIDDMVTLDVSIVADAN